MKQPPSSQIDIIDAHVGCRIRYRRKFLKISQGQLGNAVGISFQQIQKYERGFNRVCASRLYRISVTLDVPVSFFFENLPRKDKERPISLNAVPNDILSRELCAAFWEIGNVKLRQCLFESIKAAAKAF